MLQTIEVKKALDNLCNEIWNRKEIKINDIKITRMKCGTPIDVDCDENDIGKAKSLLCFKLQRIIEINEQKITLALEPSIIYKANKISDIWLFDCNKKDRKSVV